MKENIMQPDLDSIQRRILLIRGRKVVVDADLAAIYGVSTKVLNQAIRRNKDRFPGDFMFRLTTREKTEVVTNCDHLQNLKYSAVNPCVFTEHGAIMAASVLNSPRAIELSVFVVRAFVQLRGILAGHKELQQKIERFERRLIGHDQQDNNRRQPYQQAHTDQLQRSRSCVDS